MAVMKKKRNFALVFVASMIVATGLISWGLVQPASAKPGYSCNHSDPGHGDPGCHVTATTKPPAPPTTKAPAPTTTKKPTTTKAPAPPTTKAPQPAAGSTTTATAGIGTSTTTLPGFGAASEEPITTLVDPSATTLSPTTNWSESTTTTGIPGLVAGVEDTDAGSGGGLTGGWTALVVALGVLAAAGWTGMAVVWARNRRTAAAGGAASADPLRFVLAERLAHWLYAFCFLAAGVTGALMWIPSTAQWMAGAYLTISRYHGYVGLAMVIVPLAVFVVLDRRRLAEDRRALDEWGSNDRRWLSAALSGGMLRRKKMPPQGRFNAGQKVNSLLVSGLTVGFVVTGTLLMARGYLPVWLTPGVLFCHKVLAIAGATLLVGHVGMALLTSHGRGGLKAMVTGLLPAKIAREGHSIWYAEWLGQNRRANEGRSAAGEGGLQAPAAPPSA